MSEAIPSAVDCCAPCDETLETTVPGAQGPAGAAGTNGTNGLNAYTALTADFTMPALGGSVVANVGSNAWAAINQKIFVGVGAAQGTFQVTAKSGDGLQLTITNLESATLYTDNSPPGTIFASGARVGPGGDQGPSGAAAAGVLLAANNLSDVANTATSRTNLGLGTAATRTIGVANGNVAPVDDAAGLTAGEAVFATANGIESLADPAARSALGLVLGTADTEIAPVDDAAGLTAGEAVFATATGLESLTPAAARTALGISTGPALAFKAHKNAPQATPVAGVPTKVTFATVFDPDAVFDDALDRYIPGIANVIVQMHAMIKTDDPGGSPRLYTISIYKNGALFAEKNYVVPLTGTSGAFLEIAVTDQPSLTTDYYEVFITMAAPPVGMPSSVTSTYFEGHAIG